MTNPDSPRDGRSAGAASRRDVLKAAAGAAAMGIAGASQTTTRASTMSLIKNGRIKQSIVHWCYEPHWKDHDAFIKMAKDLGCVSVELAPPEMYPKLKAAGLTNAIAQIDISPDLPFVKGFNNPADWERVIAATRKSIDDCAEYGFPNVICFTGNAEGISPEKGAANAVEGLRKIVPYAAEKGVTLCLEMLNTRADDHPMKGHPGYQGNHVDYCVDIIRKVGSPNLKLLFDFYHVQIMDGDLIRRVHQLKDVIGHIHTAGNPGRCELDGKQEIHYPPLMQALIDVGYDGYVGHEFIPTRDPLEGLKEAVTLCDV